MRVFTRGFGIPVLNGSTGVVSTDTRKVAVVGFNVKDPGTTVVVSLLDTVGPGTYLFLNGYNNVSGGGEVKSLVLPVTTVHNRNASGSCFPPRIPSLPTFVLRHTISSTVHSCTHSC